MAAATSPARIPTPSEVRQIAAMRDPVLRNLRITDCYSRISSVFAASTGPCANWCTFATWASRQAGSTIRGEDMLSRFGDALRERSSLLHPVQWFWRLLVRRGVFYPETRLGRLVRQIHTPFDAFERASDAVARGNLKVFEEIALQFARFLDISAGAAGVDTFLESLRPGDPPDGQSNLRAAFLLYHQQASEQNPARRSQMIFLANLLIGQHEQARLQPEIREALESMPETIATQSRLLRLIRPLTRGLSRFARDLTCRVVTESLMVMRLPGGVTLQLGRHLARERAAVLSPVEIRELEVLLHRFAADDCGADDWSELEQRMRYITHLFCCYHVDSDLFSPPFTSQQVAEIESGRVPSGDL